MNPYEAILGNNPLKKAAPRPSQPSQAPKEQQSTVLSRATKRRQLPKPRNRLNVEHRYQFDLPEPPMDLMMLNGTMSPDAFGTPQSIPIERLARARALPAEPRFGLCGNLLDTSLYRKSVKLTIEDEALLLRIESENKTPIAIAGAAPRTGKGVAGMAPLQRRAMAPAPWMRRMSYDEYFGRSNTQKNRSVSKFNSNGRAALGQSNRTRRNSMPLKPKPTIERSFMLAGKVPTHPDRRKKHLRAVKVTPLFPDFSTLGDEFISMQFERNMNLTHREREKQPELYKKAAMKMATISLAGEDDKKFLASYTPSDNALESLRDSDGENALDADAKMLVYDWVSEYAIDDVGMMSLTASRRDAASKKRQVRPMYALRTFTCADTKKRVATLSRVQVAWKLRQRYPPLPQLGKPNMKITLEPFTKDDEAKKLQNSLAVLDK